MNRQLPIMMHMTNVMILAAVGKSAVARDRIEKIMTGNKGQKAWFLSYIYPFVDILQK